MKTHRRRRLRVIGRRRSIPGLDTGCYRTVCAVFAKSETQIVSDARDADLLDVSRLLVVGCRQLISTGHSAVHARNRGHLVAGLTATCRQGRFLDQSFSTSVFTAGTGGLRANSIAGISLVAKRTEQRLTGNITGFRTAHPT